VTTASVIISSYNYAAYLRQAIDSALAQTRAHPATEVIVVDDGSTDDSPQIIRSYGGRVRAIFNDNGGQASSLNAGFGASRGEVILFLDSDDLLEPDAVRHAVSLIDASVSKAHWPVQKVDASDRRLGQLVPNQPLPAGDLREAVLRHGPRSDAYVWPPTSGNAWSRDYLVRVMPMPVVSYRTCPDLYLCGLAPLYGNVVAISQPLSAWRVHGQNHTGKDPFRLRVERYVKLWEACCEDLERHARGLGLSPEAGRWRRESWWHRLRRASQALAELLPAGQTLALVDDETWACDDLDGRRVMRLTPGGAPPADDAEALRHLNVCRAEGAVHLVFAWPAFWWIDHYRQLAHHLRARGRCVAQTEDFVVFALPPEGVGHG